MNLSRDIYFPFTKEEAFDMVKNLPYGEFQKRKKQRLKNIKDANKKKKSHVKLRNY